MAITIINPNSTAAMTQAMVEAAAQAAPELRFEGWTSVDGPASIQGPEDGAAAGPPLLKLVQKASQAGSEGIIIGCFDDTALAEAAQLARCPVVGLGQASYHFAALRGWRFSVVTTLAVSVPILKANIKQQGLTPFLAQVHASDVPVLELEANPVSSARHVADTARQAEAHDEIAAVILGCAGMVHVLHEVQQAVALEVIDPVACAARSMRWLGQG